ncbi:MAG: dTMP kinase [Deltaproteobacteria bacterium]|nr:dTMP kinase [Deltaproteobacteria bacterium]
MFIALEGIDGSGHTTQARALQKALAAQGRDVYVTAEPSAGPVGKVIRDYLQGRIGNFERFPESLALLFAADRLHHIATEIKPKLEAGIDVICDRYVLSSWVYQGLEVTEDWVRRINQFAPLPDLTLVIDTPLIEAKQRRDLRGSVQEIFETQKIQENIRERYLDLAPSVHAVIVDGSGKSEEVTKRLLDAVVSSRT